MTIDERIDRFTERHEGLILSMQLLNADFRQISTLVREMAEGIKGLTAIVRNHEVRIPDLEK